ncbi:TIGR04255 family protein [Sinorhizobium meliloti]|uniref:TIGR04255 family protein n=1 Tax=Rhizobium meliloti TaxID=382 RepID=UPI0013E3514D|nr:TIGR04255 family protein [Sinorhizobium meliloti]
MSFSPVSDEHAIVEVVFGLSFARPFSTHDIEIIAKNHDRWKDQLPRMSRSQALQLIFGDAPPPAEIQVPSASGGIIFDRVKPDGTLDWRLKIEGNAIFVNCLSYTRWADVWPRARAFMHDACMLMHTKGNPVAGAILQYIDVFEWRDRSKAYDAAELLHPNSLQLTVARRAMNHLWHAHHGWFRGSEKGRYLERLHIDSVQNEEAVPIIKIDTYIQLQLSSPWSAEKAFGDDLVDIEFDDMHRQQKHLLLEVITPEMAERIKLHV